MRSRSRIRFAAVVHVALRPTSFRRLLVLSSQTDELMREVSTVAILPLVVGSPSFRWKVRTPSLRLILANMSARSASYSSSPSSAKVLRMCSSTTLTRKGLPRMCSPRSLTLRAKSPERGGVYLSTQVLHNLSRFRDPPSGAPPPRLKGAVPAAAALSSSSLSSSPLGPRPPAPSSGSLARLERVQLTDARGPSSVLTKLEVSPR
mmetsp:Transcript_2885/g.6774  ORF Transcript_2885/g.6774 Transcript_2885/m.6774 type:complete len:205 (+) Transcript_2885:876-1490(+)